MPASSFAACPPDAREHEVQLLVDLVRLSRLTLLYAEAGSDKSTFLSERVMPLLRSTSAAQREVCVVFDMWDRRPLPDLLLQLHAAVATAAADIHEPSALAITPLSLAATVRSWQQKLGVTFVVVFDRFEKYLAASPDQPELQEFDREFVLLMNASDIRANFLLSLDDEAAPLLRRLQERISGLGDASLRLPRAVTPFAQSRGVFRPHEPMYASHRDSTPIADPAASALREPVQSSSGSIRGIETSVSESHAAGGETLTHAAAQPMTSPLELSEHAPRTTASSLPLLGSARGDAQRPRVRPVARVALGVSIVGLSCLVLLAMWQPTARPPTATKGADSHAASAVPASEGAVQAPADETVPASPADDQTAFTPQHSEPQQLVVSSGLSALPPVTEVAASTDNAPRDVQAPSAQAPASSSANTRSRAQTVDRTQLTLFIHVRNEAQRAQAQRLINPLARRGIRVTGIKIVNAGPSANDLRYFHPEDRSDSAQVLRVLRDLGLAPIQVKHITGFEARATPRQYELWLARGSATSSK